MEEYDVDDRTNDNVWSNYTEGSPCIKITYGDPQTIKGNIIFSSQLRRIIWDTKRQLENLVAQAAQREELLKKLKDIYEENHKILIRQIEEIQNYEALNMEANANDAAQLKEILNSKTSGLIQMLADVTHAYTGTAAFSSFSSNVKQSINFTPSYFKISGTAWTIAALSSEDAESYCYIPVTHEPIPLEPGEEQSDPPRYYKKNDNGEWVETTLTGYNYGSDGTGYIFERTTIANLQEKKNNENILMNLYNDYDDIRINIALPIYKFAYLDYITADLSPDRPAVSQQQKEIELFYNTAIQFINLLEAYETNWGYLQEETDINPKTGTSFNAIEQTILSYLRGTFNKATREKVNKAANDYNLAKQGLAELYELIEQTRDKIALYYEYIDKIAKGTHKIQINDQTGEVELVEIGNGRDRRMFGYKYVKVGSSITAAASNIYGYIRVTINQQNVDVPVKGFENSTSGSLIASTSMTINGNLNVNGTVTGTKIYHAVFNDYAEYRKTIDLTPGHCVVDNNDGSLSCTTQRLQPGAQIISDTFGSCMGKTDECETPLAVAGRVLVYTYQPRENYQAGMAVCSAPNGTVDIMTRDEISQYCRYCFRDS